VLEADQHSVVAVRLDAEEASLLRASKWWESGPVDSGIILAVLAAVDRPDLVCHLEVCQRVLADRLDGSVSIHEVLTEEGRAKIRQRCLAMLEPKVREDLQKWVDVFLEQAMANITTIQSKLRERPPDGGIGWRNLSSQQARHFRDTLDLNKFFPEALAAAQLLTNKRIISSRSFQQGLDVVCRTLGVPRFSLLDYGLGENQEGRPESRMQLAVDVLAAQKPETIEQLRRLFPINAAASKLTPKKPAADQSRASGPLPARLPRIDRISLQADDFVAMPSVESFFSKLLSQEPDSRLRPVYALKSERQAEIRERAPHSVIDLTSIPEEWLTWWEGLNCHGIITLAQILVASNQCVVNGQLFCSAIVSRPVAVVPLADIAPAGQRIMYYSFERFLPYCKNRAVLRDLIERGRSLGHFTVGPEAALVFTVGSEIALIYEADPVWASKVTVADASSVVTELSVVVGIDGPGSFYVRRLASATSVGKNVYCVESVDKKGRKRMSPFPGRNPMIGDKEWRRNSARVSKTVLTAGSGEIVPSIEAPSAEIEGTMNEGRWKRIGGFLRRGKM
jgi:hypothetical protein